jgi:hypothetical protein
VDPSEARRFDAVDGGLAQSVTSAKPLPGSICREPFSGPFIRPPQLRLSLDPGLEAWGPARGVSIAVSHRQLSGPGAGRRAQNHSTGWFLKRHGDPRPKMTISEQRRPPITIACQASKASGSLAGGMARDNKSMIESVSIAYRHFKLLLIISPA